MFSCVQTCPIHPIRAMLVDVSWCLKQAQTKKVFVLSPQSSRPGYYLDEWQTCFFFCSLFTPLPGREFGSSVGLSLVIGLQENDVISGLESEILREKTRQFQLDHELVIGTRDLEVMSCLGLMRGQNQGRFLLEGIKLAMKVLVVVGENVLKGWVREELGPFVKLKLAISLCHFPRWKRRRQNEDSLAIPGVELRGGEELHINGWIAASLITFSFDPPLKIWRWWRRLRMGTWVPLETEAALPVRKSTRKRKNPTLSKD